MAENAADGFGQAACGVFDRLTVAAQFIGQAEISFATYFFQFFRIELGIGF